MEDKQIEEIGTQIVKRKRQRSDLQLQVEPGDNARYINHALRLSDLGKVKLSDNDAVKERIRQYFEICAEEDMKPSVSGLAVALGTDRKYLWDIRTGREGKSPEVRETLNNAVALLELQLVDYMQNGKLNPVSSIFLLKNNFGYSDKQEITITPNQPLGQERSISDIEQEYIDSVVTDD